MHTIDKHVETDAKCPDVCNLPMIGRPLTHLRGQEGGGTHRPYSGVSVVDHAGTAKVADLHPPIRCQ